MLGVFRSPGYIYYVHVLVYTRVNYVHACNLMYTQLNITCSYTCICIVCIISGSIWMMCRCVPLNENLALIFPSRIGRLNLSAPPANLVFDSPGNLGGKRGPSNGRV